MKDDVRSVGGPAAFRDFIAHAVLGFPVDRFRAFPAGQALDFHLLADHEYGIEAQAEMADNVALLLRLVLKLLHELRRAGKSDLVDIFPHLVRRHPDAGIGNPDRLPLLVHRYRHGHLFFAVRMQHPVFGDRVAGVGNLFPQENILVGIKPALNDGHNILRINRYGSVLFLNCHNVCLLVSRKPPRDMIFLGSPILYHSPRPKSRKN